MFNEKLDEKYSLKVTNGTVEITRSGEPWLVNPVGAKAWISAAAALEDLRTPTDLSNEETAELVQKTAEHLASVWGWLADEPEAIQLATNLVELLGRAVLHTNTRPEVLLSALLHPGNRA